MNPKLPPLCAAYHPTTGAFIIIRQGKPGFEEVERSDPPGETVEGFNAKLDVAPWQVNAMLAGSMFGWNCPGANPTPPAPPTAGEVLAGVQAVCDPPSAQSIKLPTTPTAAVTCLMPAPEYYAGKGHRHSNN